MNCSHWGRPVRPEHITGTNLLRIVPEHAVPGTAEKRADVGSVKILRETDGSGWPLDVACAGMTTWVSAECCLPCKKVITQIHMADMREEELQ